MDRILQWFISIPPITRYWSLAIISVSIATTTKIVKYGNLIFIPDRAFGSQYWRLLTSFCYFGDLSFELILSIWLIIRSCRFLEESYSTNLALFPTNINKLTPHQMERLIKIIEKNNSIDYLYYVFLICWSIVCIATYIHRSLNLSFVALGSLLDDILLYIWCRSNPNLEVNIFGLLTIQTAYLPLCNAFLNWALSGSFFQDLQIMSMGNLTFIEVVFKQPYFWKTLICFSLGHFFWFVRDFLINSVYYDKNIERRKYKESTFFDYKVERFNIVKILLTGIFLPPWYWIVLNKLRRA